ncbi:hypothetical protein CYLTODRAFT_418497 [Cylindrobasidium torrendii FP15055 ss-10]|uniref:F-box domain-containing protein n=1 Tax=Cylindrobasidium torrendii FP15055 ss-10 TaxID=1314674 RepID=A0A0D7BNM3_9AGAR|nr:hypothetical protein CYLTODRAFT_418497 [Cylindrobasidium torrendii FP15055 ss-10]
MSTSLRDSSAKSLPDSIIRGIVEACARDAQEFAPTLGLVSHQVLKWVEPVFYHTVKLNSQAHAIVFLRTVRERAETDPTFFADNVRTLIFAADTYDWYQVPFLQRAIDACPGLISLSLPFPVLPSLNLRRLPSLTRLQLLQWPPDTTSRELNLPGITHLSIRSIPACLNWADVFKTCSDLTHIMLELNTATMAPCAQDKIISDLLEELPSRVELVVIQLARERVGELNARDPRLVYFWVSDGPSDERTIHPHDVDALCGWNHSEADSGGQDIWQRAKRLASKDAAESNFSVADTDITNYGSPHRITEAMKSTIL